MANILSFAPENLLAAATTNFPQYLFSMVGGAYCSAIAFDSSTSEKCRTTAFVMPPFTAPLTLNLKFVIAATSGNIQFRVQIEAVTDADAQNISTTSNFDTANSSGSISVPTSTFVQKQALITLTNNSSVVAGDRVVITIDRDVSVALNASGDCYLLVANLKDAS